MNWSHRQRCVYLVPYEEQNASIDGTGSQLWFDMLIYIIPRMRIASDPSVCRHI